MTPRALNRPMEGGILVQRSMNAPFTIIGRILTSALCGSRIASPTVAIAVRMPSQLRAKVADPTFKAQLVDFGMEPFTNSPAEFGKFIVECTKKWGEVIGAAGTASFRSWHSATEEASLDGNNSLYRFNFLTQRGAPMGGNPPEIQACNASVPTEPLIFDRGLLPQSTNHCGIGSHWDTGE